MKNLLDHELLNGPLEVQTGLRPQCIARCVTNIHQAEQVAIQLCQIWGGVGNPIVPVVNGSAAGYLAQQLIKAEIDGYDSVDEDVQVTIPFMEVERPWDYPAVMILAHETLNNPRPVEVIDLSPTDPWRLIYLATLGQMPSTLADEDLCFRAAIDPLAINSIIPVERASVNGSLDDLIQRLTNREKITPRQFSTLYLVASTDPNTGYMGAQNDALPNRWESAIAAGPNVIVVMTQGSVNDFSLLWNLRSIWGDQRAMPVGIPKNELTDSALHRLHEPGITTFFGFGGGHLYLVSETVSLEELREFANQAPGVEVATPSELLQLGHAPCRAHSQVQIWTEGSARLNPVTDRDREILSATVYRPPSLKLSARVPDFPLVTAGTLRAPFSADYQCGGAQISIPSRQRNRTVRIEWPSTWTMLSATALEAGLEVRESQPGIAAMSLLRAIDDVPSVLYLCDEKVIALLYDLAERSGMSWWKSRWTRLEQRLKDEGKTDVEIEDFANLTGRDEPAVAPTSEGRQLTYSKFLDCFGSRQATDAWIGWAIDRRLIVKGVELKCPACRVPFWLPMPEMAPPHTCPGCARDVAHPYRPDGINFKYRIGEVVRRCLELDALGHVLALRWLTELFDRQGLIGAHPGVEFLRDGKIIAEVDVLLLFQDGSIVPVEVKRRASGFNAASAAQLDSLSSELRAEFDVVCAMEPSGNCQELVQYKRFLPDRPRFVLTLDQLQQKYVVWRLGANPFEDELRPDLSAEQHRNSWVSEVIALGSERTDPARMIIEDWRRRLRDDT